MNEPTEHLNEPSEQQGTGKRPRTTATAVLLLSYGGPNSLDDVAAYLHNIRGGRPTPPELVEDVKRRYALIGGRSPLLERTQAQARALQAWLDEHLGPGYHTYVGMRNWHPFVHEVLPDIVASGAKRLIAIPMSPQYSRVSVELYRRALEEALAQVEAPLEVHFVERWGDHPGFVAAYAEKVHHALAHKFPPDAQNVAVVFTAHSIPLPLVEQGDPYPHEVAESARLIAETVGLDRWHVAYQSAGARQVPWLGPDVNQILERLAAEGTKHVLIVPVGFVADHVEILYDIDIEMREQTTRLGVHLERTDSLNDSPLLIAALGQMVVDSLNSQSAP